MTDSTPVCYHEIVAELRKNRQQRFLLALLVGAFFGLIVGVAIKRALSDGGSFDGPSPPDWAEDSPEESVIPEVVRDGVAWQYVEAYQGGNWPRVVELTLWMEERLAFVAASEGTEAVATERAQLEAQVSERRIADNHLRDVGVDDQYIFVPGARIEYVRDDAGHDDLAAEVARRTWFRVTYPAREKALLDKDGLPIRSILVGVNVSIEGRVLKAEVVGNLDIDWDSITYDWPSR